ncbi:hypothetical protein NDA14_006248 [Ustilago hordei]|nr:hypothetical protein NDA15_005197 [Ustilago hordei]KAJ1577272.1 hypothetical protein NDA12_004251 [Ustilago hordei]KAJ1597115.1 hypothetical protein NDA14_006248 [Ustilago hordei]UTT89659.1 hypothetical protein NDA17_003849 [Ustilago hordei]
MTSQPPTSSSTATTSSQSFLLAPLQSSTCSNVPITPGKARKQAQAQRTRLVAVRIQLYGGGYANFKVKHGWSKQSLSEVENLYYRQHQSSTSTGSSNSNATASAAATAGKSASTSPNNNASKAPVTPSVAARQGQVGVGSRLFKDAAIKKIDIEGGDVFGGYGLATPPASVGSFSGATSYLTSKRGRSTSSTPISPPNASAASCASKGADAARPGTKRSPNSGNNSSNNNNSSSRRLAGSASATSGGATSYADFWSRVGSSAATSTAAATNTTLRSDSPSKKRSVDEVSADQAVGSRGADSGADSGTDSGANSGANSGATGATNRSPHKRVRMESDGDRASTASASNSPAKAALANRGPSFASSVGRH